MADYSYGNFLPRPFGVSYEVNQNVVTVLVPYEPFKGIYNNYELQRSDDGEIYRTVKDASFYSFSSSSDDPKYSVYNDSVISKASTVFYRLRGRTSFDVFGPFSDTLEVKIMHLVVNLISLLVVEPSLISNYKGSFMLLAFQCFRGMVFLKQLQLSVQILLRSTNWVLRGI